MENRVCIKCKQRKSINEFAKYDSYYKNRKNEFIDGRSIVCKFCRLSVVHSGKVVKESTKEKLKRYHSDKSKKEKEEFSKKIKEAVNKIDPKIEKERRIKQGKNYSLRVKTDNDLQNKLISASKIGNDAFWAEENIENQLKRNNKISKSRSEKICKGEIGCPLKNSKKGYFYSKKNNKKYYYRSSYELKAYEILEKDDDILDYNSEPFHIQYFDENGIKRRTIPDIIVTHKNGSKILIEVKPKSKLKYIEREQIKINAMKEYCLSNNINFWLWTEEELF